MTSIPHEPVREPGAWRGAELAGDASWIVPFTPADIAEIETAAERTAADGLTVYGFGKEDFSLPSLAPKFESWLDELENGRGFLMLRGLPVGRWDDDMLYRVYWGLGQHLGTPLTQNKRGELIVEIANRGTVYGPNVRGYMTTAHLQFHSDASDLVALLCVHPAKSGGASMIASGLAIYNEILATHPEYIAPLCRGFHHNMRGEGVSGNPDEVTRNAIPVFSWHAGRLSCHYNQRLIEQGAEKLGRPLQGLTLEAVRYVGELARREDIRLSMDFRAGDIQLLNNHIVMHSRTGFEDHEDSDRRRRLLRLWTNMPNGRPLAPEYADRTNNGPRGGMAVDPAYRAA